MPTRPPPTAEACIFCDIAAHRAPGFLLYEDDWTVAFLDLYPFTRGHFLVIPRRHGPRLEDLEESDRTALMRTVDRLCRRVSRLAPDYN
ncbi:HIT family protein, partial [mine drainage metagenome]